MRSRPGQDQTGRPASARPAVLRKWVAGAAALLALGAAQAQVLSNTRSLDFGRFAASGGGTVRVDPNGARTRSGSVVLLPPSGGASASFTVTDADPANADKAYVITVPDNGAVTLTSAGNSMSLSNFVSYPAGVGMLVAGSQTITVGATLTVAPGQPSGNYSGSFNVTINYQ